MRGRQVLFMLHDHSSTNMHGSTYALQDLFSVHLKGENLKTFISNWDEVLAGIVKVPEESVLETLFYNQVKNCKAIAHDLNARRSCEALHPLFLSHTAPDWCKLFGSLRRGHANLQPLQDLIAPFSNLEIFQKWWSYRTPPLAFSQTKACRGHSYQSSKETPASHFFHRPIIDMFPAVLPGKWSRCPGSSGRHWWLNHRTGSRTSSTISASVGHTITGRDVGGAWELRWQITGQGALFIFQFR